MSAKGRQAGHADSLLVSSMLKDTSPPLTWLAQVRYAPDAAADKAADEAAEFGRDQISGVSRRMTHLLVSSMLIDTSPPLSWVAQLRCAPAPDAVADKAAAEAAGLDGGGGNAAASSPGSAPEEASALEEASSRARAARASALAAAACILAASALACGSSSASGADTGAGAGTGAAGSASSSSLGRLAGLASTEGSRLHNAQVVSLSASLLALAHHFVLTESLSIVPAIGLRLLAPAWAAWLGWPPLRALACASQAVRLCGHAGLL